VDRDAMAEKLRLVEAGLATAIDSFEGGASLEDALSDLEECSHALSVYVREIEIVVDATPEPVAPVPAVRCKHPIERTRKRHGVGKARVCLLCGHRVAREECEGVATRFE
jgi:hypothetical protein